MKKKKKKKKKMFDEILKKKEKLKKIETIEKTVLNIVGTNYPSVPKERRCVLILSGYYRPYHEFVFKNFFFFIIFCILSF